MCQSPLEQNNDIITIGVTDQTAHKVTWEPLNRSLGQNVPHAPPPSSSELKRIETDFPCLGGLGAIPAIPFLRSSMFISFSLRNSIPCVDIVYFSTQSCCHCLSTHSNNICETNMVRCAKEESVLFFNGGG